MLLKAKSVKDFISHTLRYFGTNSTVSELFVLDQMYSNPAHEDNNIQQRKHLAPCKLRFGEFLIREESNTVVEQASLPWSGSMR